MFCVQLRCVVQHGSNCISVGQVLSFCEIVACGGVVAVNRLVEVCLGFGTGLCFSVCVHLYVCASVCVCVCGVRACVHACLRACVRACMLANVCVHVYL